MGHALQLITQPENSTLCGQSCIAMVAGIPLERAIATVGHTNGTFTSDLIKALRKHGVGCADRLRRISRKRPVLPKRCIVVIVQWTTDADGTRRQRHAHWMVSWDGVIYDPGASWPERYASWTMTSYLELL